MQSRRAHLRNLLGMAAVAGNIRAELNTNTSMQEKALRAAKIREGVTVRH